MQTDPSHTYGKIHHLFLLKSLVHLITIQYYLDLNVSDTRSQMQARQLKWTRPI